MTPLASRGLLATVTGADALSEFCDDLAGLATARTVLTATVAARIAIRDLMQIEVIGGVLLWVKLCTKRVTQMGEIGYYKSNHYSRLQYAKKLGKAALE